MIEIQEREYELFLDTIREKSVYDFTNYSAASLKRRLNKILHDNHLSFSQMENKLRNDQHFLEEVVKGITVNTTELFRDPNVWIYLREEVIPAFSYLDRIKILHAGASTGQEVYSMMILLNEMQLLTRSDIYASDLNTDVLENSRKGVYKFSFNQEYLTNFDTVFNSSQANGKVNYSKYFEVDRLGDTIRMKDYLTNKPVYKKMDLVKDDNVFGINFDIIICRNVIIYFNYELQNKVFNLFFNSLTPRGALVLGLHESIIGPYTTGFEKRGQVYYKSK
jgi:chemotaxis protein methyltransferase CheR